MHESTTDPHEDLVALLDLDVDPLGAESVDSLRLSQEENPHLLPLGEGVDVVGQSLVNLAVLLGDVDGLVPRELVVQSAQLVDLFLGKFKFTLQVFQLF